MNKITFLIFTCFCTLASYSQINEFAPEAAYWTFATGNFYNPFEGVYVVEKDTINETPCKKIDQEYFYTDSLSLYVLINDEFKKMIDFESEIGDTIVVVEEGFEGFLFWDSFYLGEFSYIVEGYGLDEFGFPMIYTSPTESTVWVLGNFSTLYGSDNNLKGPFGQPTVVYFPGDVIIGAICYSDSMDTYLTGSYLECNPFSNPTGINLLDDNEEILVYPNPSQGDLRLIVPTSDEDRVLEIYNSLGKLVAEYQIERFESEKNIRIKELGIYYWKLNGINGRFIIQ